MSYLIVRIEEGATLEADPSIAYSVVGTDAWGEPCEWLTFRVEEEPPLPAVGEVCAFTSVVDGDVLAAARKVWGWIHRGPAQFYDVGSEEETHIWAAIEGVEA